MPTNIPFPVAPLNGKPVATSSVASLTSIDADGKVVQLEAAFTPNVTGTNRFGMKNAGGIFLHEDRSTEPAVKIGAALRTQFDLSYTGGTPGFVTSSHLNTMSVGAGVVDFCWAGLDKLASSAAAGQNVARYVQARKLAAGPVWAFVSEFRDETQEDDPTGGSYAQEVDIVANGTDLHDVRTGIGIIGFRHNASGAAAEFGFGLSIQPGASDVGQILFKRGIYLKGIYNRGIDLSDGIFNVFAMKIPATSKFYMDDLRNLRVETGMLIYRNEALGGSGDVFSVDSTGHVVANGYNLRGETLSSTPVDGDFEHAEAFTLTNAQGRGIVPAAMSVWLYTDNAGADVNTAQPIFPAAGDTLTLADGVLYEFESQIRLVRSAGTTSHTTAFQIGGGYLGSGGGDVHYIAQVSNGTSGAISSISHVAGDVVSAVVLTAANTSATEEVIVTISGTLRTTGSKSIIPQIIYSAAPGGAPTFKAGSFFRIWPAGVGTLSKTYGWA